jgi:hypothetical protein
VKGGKLHLFQQSEHALDACLTNRVDGLCPAGDEESRSLVADSLRQAREWLLFSAKVSPTVTASGPAAVNAGATGVVLDGAASDADGIISRYRWTQTAGPAVTLASPNAARTTFTAPNLTADAVLAFRLTVTDNSGATGMASVQITVRAPIAIPHLRALYWACPSLNQACASSSGWALTTSSDYGGTRLGYIKTVQEPGTVPLYWACLGFNIYGNGQCTSYALRTSPATWQYGTLPATLLGYARTTSGADMVPLYWACTSLNLSNGTCATGTVQTTPANPPLSSVLMGYLYKSTTRPAM